MADIDTYLSNKLFDRADRSLIVPLLEKCDELRLESDRLVFRDGDVGDALYLIGRGAIQITKMGRGDRQEILYTFHAGDFFGEMALLDDQPRSASAQTVTSARLLKIDNATFEALLSVTPTAIIRNLVRTANARLRASNDHFIKELLRAERLSLLGSMAGGIIHDLKNPLTASRLACEMLAASMDQGGANLARMAIEGLDDAFDMIQELLDFSRGEHRSGTESCEPADLMDEVVKRISSLAESRSIALQVTRTLAEGASLVVDRRRIVRCFLNIARNAIDAMPHGGTLSIACRYEGGNTVAFDFADTGVGIKSEDLPHLFEPFFTSGKAAGTGLGLALCHAVVSAHGGRISVESSPGAGARFTVLLPYA